MSLPNSDKKPQVLIVDDVPANIEMLAQLLRGQYLVRVATNGERGLEIVFLAFHDIRNACFLGIMLRGIPVSGITWFFENSASRKPWFFEFMLCGSRAS